jgi:hypothetical protein
VRPEAGPKKELASQFRRTLVDYRTKEPAGTIIVDTPNTYLYLATARLLSMRQEGRDKTERRSRSWAAPGMTAGPSPCWLFAGTGWRAVGG